MVLSQMSRAVQPLSFNTDTLAGFWRCFSEDEPACWQCGPALWPPKGTLFFSCAQEHRPGSIPGMTESLPSARHQTDCATDSCRQDRLRCGAWTSRPREAVREARVSTRALVQGRGAGLGQPAQRLPNYLSGGGLASFLPSPVLEAVCLGSVGLSGRLSHLGLGADPTTAVSG